MTKLLQVIKPRGAFILGSFSACCLSISIDLSFEYQYHIITPVHVVIVGFYRSFINACHFERPLRYKLRSDLMQNEEVLCFLYLEIQLNLISTFDRAIFCMTSPHSLWFSEIIKSLHCA